jgi:hypothetical protein
MLIAIVMKRNKRKNQKPTYKNVVTLLAWSWVRVLGGVYHALLRLLCGAQKPAKNMSGRTVSNVDGPDTKPDFVPEILGGR